jgi:hypothetical protein
MSRYLRAKRSWGVLIAVGALALASVSFPATSFADQAGGCDFAPTGTTPSCQPPLSPSKFEGGDGNLVVNTAGNKDWSNVGDLNTGIDKPSGQGDNAFGQGTKEDNADVSIVNGSIPPNKSDLSRFYEASETVGSGSSAQTFLYLAWERTNVLGSANMDFEINQKSTAGFTGDTTGKITLNRTPGDMLITFDFTNGGGRPTLGLNRWLTSTTSPVIPGFATNACLSSNSFPCWGDHVTLSGTISEGAVNNLGSVTDPNLSNVANNVGINRFGEAVINLTNSGVFGGGGTCVSFASTFLKSRASASFPAEVKDFVAPVPTTISNCGEVTIIKHTDPRGLNQDFSYTSTLAGSQIDCTSDTTPDSFTLNDNGNTTGDSSGNTEDCLKVPAGSYSVTEGAEPGSFSLDSLSCTATTGSSGTQDGVNPAKANITLLADGHVTCTYVNKGAGAILVTKTAKNVGLGSGQHPLAGATFTVNGVSKVTDGNGQACFDGLAIGTTYTVAETSAPSGYSIDTASKDVTVSASATCASGTPDGVSFTDSPLTDISVNATSEIPGATNSSISCVDSSSADVGNSPQGPADPVTVTANGLAPGIYTCTIDIDP